MEKTKEAVDRCKCCLEKTGLKNMWSDYYSDGEKEIYGEMLRDCFALSWEQPAETDTEYICDTCIVRLQDALSFKKEILSTDKLLKEKQADVVTENILKQEEESDEEIETEYLNIEYLDDEDDGKDNSEIKLEQNTEIVKKELIGKIKKYKEEDLQKCLEAVRTKSLTRYKASLVYNVPRRAISEALANEQLLEDPVDTKKRKRPELQKLQDNVDCIIKYTNATPFKGFLRIGYACFFCSVEYEKAIDLKEHTIVEHCSENQLRATVISDRSMKLDITDLVCRICEESLDTLENLLDHLRLGHNKNIHTDVQNFLVPFKFDSDVLRCVVCSEEFASFKLLNDHLNLNHFKNYECHECGRGFINKKTLQSHKYRHETGIFTCTYCLKIFTTSVRRWDHERSVHIMNNRRYKCGYCGERFINIAKKNEHEVVVHSAAKLTYKCQACSKIYDTQKSLRIHVRSYHLMLRPFVCSVCGIGFFKNVDLKIHMVIHTGEKNYECEVCNKAFGRKSTLREHMRIHENDKRFECEICGYAFVQKCSWKGHMRAKHGVEV